MVDPALKLSVKLPAGTSAEVDVRLLDAPGPSGYGLLNKIEGVAALPGPEIDSLVLMDKATLRAFLCEVVTVHDGPVTVVCLEPRLPRLRELLDAKPGEKLIDVDLTNDG